MHFREKGSLDSTTSSKHSAHLFPFACEQISQTQFSFFSFLEHFSWKDLKQFLQKSSCSFASTLQAKQVSSFSLVCGSSWIGTDSFEFEDSSMELLAWDSSECFSRFFRFDKTTEMITFFLFWSCFFWESDDSSLLSFCSSSFLLNFFWSFYFCEAEANWTKIRKEMQWATIFESFVCFFILPTPN